MGPMPRPLALHPHRLFPADPQGKCANPAGTVSVGCISVLSDTIDPAGVMTAGTFSGVDTRVEDRFDSMHTNFTQVTLNGTHDLSDKWSVDELVGYFESRFNNPQQTTLGWDQYNQTFSYNFDIRIPYLNFGSENVGSVSGISVPPGSTASWATPNVFLAENALDPKWSMRVSGTYRSAYLIRVPGQETGTDADGYDATFNLDASLQYNLTKRFRLTLEGVSLTDQYENEFDDTSRDLMYYYHNQGREILFGVRYQY